MSPGFIIFVVLTYLMWSNPFVSLFAIYIPADVYCCCCWTDSAQSPVETELYLTSKDAAEELLSEYIRLPPFPAQQKVNARSWLLCQPPVAMEMDTGSSLSGLPAWKGGPLGMRDIRQSSAFRLFSFFFKDRFSCMFLGQEESCEQNISLLFSWWVNRWQACFLTQGKRYENA